MRIDSREGLRTRDDRRRTRLDEERGRGESAPEPGVALQDVPPGSLVDVLITRAR